MESYFINSVDNPFVSTYNRNQLSPYNANNNPDGYDGESAGRQIETNFLKEVFNYVYKNRLQRK